MSRVPFFRSELARESLVAAAAAVDLDAPSIVGPATLAVESELALRFSSRGALLTQSATAALEVVALSLAARGYSRAIVPSFAHVSCASAFHLPGYQVHFADVGEDLLVDPESVARLGPDARTVVLAVEYAGAPSDHTALGELCRATGAVLVADLAHAFGSRSGQPRPDGSAVAGVLSFHLTKEVTCGEGGALLASDEELLGRATTTRNRGTDRSEFEQGLVDRYTWVSPGSAFAPSELTAAVLLEQLGRSAAVLARRRTVLASYVEGLADWAERVGARLPVAATEVGAANLAFVDLVHPGRRVALAAHLAERGIGTAFHFPPLHLSAMGRCIGGRPGLCPGAERAFDAVIRLPLSSHLTDADLDLVIEAVTSWRDTSRAPGRDRA